MEKYYWGRGYAAIQVCCYDASIASLNEAANVAMQDFPKLTARSIHVERSAAPGRTRMPLLMFPIPEGAIVPEDYRRVRRGKKLTDDRDRSYRKISVKKLPTLDIFSEFENPVSEISKSPSSSPSNKLVQKMPYFKFNAVKPNTASDVVPNLA